MSNIYKGRIRNVNPHYEHDKSAIVGFISTDGDTKGLSILIIYEILGSNSRKLFTEDLENRLKENNKGVLVEVFITKSISRDVRQYEGIGPIRFLEDEPPRAA